MTPRFGLQENDFIKKWFKKTLIIVIKVFQRERVRKKTYNDWSLYNFISIIKILAERSQPWRGEKNEWETIRIFGVKFFCSMLARRAWNTIHPFPLRATEIFLVWEIRREGGGANKENTQHQKECMKKVWNCDTTSLALKQWHSVWSLSSEVFGVFEDEYFAPPPPSGARMMV